MRDMLMLAAVAAMFVFGYFVMDKLDRFLEKLHPEEGLSAEEGASKISGPVEVENRCFQCYNSGCKNRVRHPARCCAGQEEQAWKQPGKTRIGFLERNGITVGHQGS